MDIRETASCQLVLIERFFAFEGDKPAARRSAHLGCYTGQRLLTAKGADMNLADMKTYCHLKPGQNGTKRLAEKYGKALLCVRYRFDEVRGIKLKTVEIIVDEKPLRAPRFKDDDLVPVHVAFDETGLRQQLRAMHARWDAERKLWYVRYKLIRGTPLEERLAELYA